MERSSNERFLAACGLSGPLRLSLKEGSIGVSRTFEVPFAVVGRDPGADLIVDHPSISRRHLYLQAVGGHLFFVDLGSRSGITGDWGHTKDGWVGYRQGIRLGPVQIRPDVKDGDEDWQHRLEDPLRSHSLGNHSATLPTVVLEFPELPERPVWKVRRVLTLVGRAADCRLRFLDSRVSKFHCSLVRTPAGVWVVDLLGRGGVELNGQCVRLARLEQGDQLRVGGHPIVVQSELPSSGRPLPASTKRGSTLAVVPNPDGQSATLLEPDYDRSPSARAHPVIELSEPAMAFIANMFGQMQQQMLARFSEMQQQMFDQFQNATLRMAQTLGTLHRDQLALVRVELDQLRRLNQDLLALQVQVDRENSSLVALPSQHPMSDVPATDESLARIEALIDASLGDAGAVSSESTNEAAPEPGDLMTNQVEVASLGKAVSAGTREWSEAESVRSGMADSAINLRSGSGELPPIARDEATEKEMELGSSEVATDLRLGKGPTVSSNHRFDAGADPATHVPDDGLHAHLCRRIASLQQERQGRWQRICDLMLGR